MLHPKPDTIRFSRKGPEARLPAAVEKPLTQGQTPAPRPSSAPPAPSAGCTAPAGLSAYFQHRDSHIRPRSPGPAERTTSGDGSTHQYSLKSPTAALWLTFTQLTVRTDELGCVSFL